MVHFKASYLTQERAMLERDGTVVLVYLFKVLINDNESKYNHLKINIKNK